VQYNSGSEVAQANYDRTQELLVGEMSKQSAKWYQLLKPKTTKDNLFSMCVISVTLLNVQQLVIILRS